MKRRIGMLDAVSVSAQVRAKASVAGIKAGKTYFLSGFRDISGAYVKALEVSPNPNHLVGWSSVKVEMLVEVGSHPGSFYKPGNVATVSACNLYERREDANPKNRRAVKCA